MATVDAVSGSGTGGTAAHPSATIERMFDVKAAAEWSARSYEVNGLDGADVRSAKDAGFPLLSALVVTIPAINRMDLVVTELDDLERAGEFFARQAGGGWEVCALVPLPLLAAAHSVCRGWATLLQGWWEPRPGELAFTSPEVP